MGVNFPQTVQPGFEDVLLSMDGDGIAGTVGTVIGELIANPILGRVSSRRFSYNNTLEVATTYRALP